MKLLLQLEWYSNFLPRKRIVCKCLMECFDFYVTSVSCPNSNCPFYRMCFGERNTEDCSRNLAQVVIVQHVERERLALWYVWARHSTAPLWPMTNSCLHGITNMSKFLLALGKLLVLSHSSSQFHWSPTVGRVLCWTMLWQARFGKGWREMSKSYFWAV